MGLAPLFTKENAAEMGRRSAERRAELIKRGLNEEKREKSLLAQQVINPPSQQSLNEDERRQARVKKQIDVLDDILEAALIKRDWEQLESTTRLKARLWPLAQPTAGVLRPKQGKQSRSTPVITETPQAPHAIPAKVAPNANVSEATPNQPSIEPDKVP